MGCPDADPDDGSRTADVNPNLRDRMRQLFLARVSQATPRAVRRRAKRGAGLDSGLVKNIFICK